MRFLFIRHGETDWNAQGLMQGLTDIPLNERGIEQAAAAAERLKSFPISKIITSPQIRARKTAEIISRSFGLNVEPDLDLRERSFGDYEGTKFQDFPVELLYGAIDAADKRVEPFQTVGQRSKTAIERWLHNHDHDQGDILFVAHGAVFVALHQTLQCGPHFRVLNAQPYKFSANDAGGWVCEVV